MDTINICLWTASLILAVAGISFGIIASINAAKANNQIKEAIADQMITEEASKYFFKIPETVNNNNKLVLRKLKSNKELLYTDYAYNAAKTRMAPMPARTEKYLDKTEFADLSSHYLHSKVRLDKLFLELLGGNFEILSEAKPITKAMRKKFISYHEQITIEQQALMKVYYTITKM